MNRNLTVIIVLFVLCVVSGAGEPRLDLSEPRMAAYLLGVAFEKGDIKTLRSIYVGKNEEFMRFIDAVEQFLLASRQFTEEMEQKYGAFAAPRASRELQLSLCGMLLNPLMASRLELKESGDAAELVHEGMLMRLRRVGTQWQITEVHILGLQVLIPFIEATTDAIREVRQDVTKGKFGKPYEAVAALGEAAARRIPAKGNSRERQDGNPHHFID